MSASPGRLATLVALPVALVVGVVAFWLLGGFPSAHRPAGPQASGPVTVANPSLDPHAAEVCRALVAKLPDSLSDRARRPVSTGTEQSAAYGDPAIVLTCGGAQPKVADDAQLLGLSGVCWVQDQRTWTTVYREVPVRVTVPAAYAQPGQWVVDFSAPIVDTVPLTAGVSADAAQICTAPSVPVS
jgi:hypothetical protein